MTVTTQGTLDRYAEKVLQYHESAAKDEALSPERRQWYATLVAQEGR